MLQTIHLNFRSFTNLQASSLAHAFSPQESSEPAPSLEAPPVSPPEEEACASAAAPPAQALPGAEQVRSGPARAAQGPADCSAAPRANVQAVRRAERVQDGSMVPSPPADDLAQDDLVPADSVSAQALVVPQAVVPCAQEVQRAE